MINLLERVFTMLLQINSFKIVALQQKACSFEKKIIKKAILFYNLCLKVKGTKYIIIEL